jgi:hypothetical protein
MIKPTTRATVEYWTISLTVFRKPSDFAQQSLTVLQRFRRVLTRISEQRVTLRLIEIVGRRTFRVPTEISI